MFIVIKFFLGLLFGWLTVLGPLFDSVFLTLAFLSSVILLVLFLWSLVYLTVILLLGKEIGCLICLVSLFAIGDLLSRKWIFSPLFSSQFRKFMFPWWSAREIPCPEPENGKASPKRFPKRLSPIPLPPFRCRRPEAILLTAPPSSFRSIKPAIIWTWQMSLCAFWSPARNWTTWLP